jgi:hypothetical protein
MGREREILGSKAPINSYRMYLRDDVMRLRKRIVDGERAA